MQAAEMSHGPPRALIELLLSRGAAARREARIGNPELFSKFSRRPPVWTKPELKLVNNSAQPEDAIVDKFLFGPGILG